MHLTKGHHLITRIIVLIFPNHHTDRTASAWNARVFMSNTHASWHSTLLTFRELCCLLDPVHAPYHHHPSRVIRSHADSWDGKMFTPEFSMRLDCIFSDRMLKFQQWQGCQICQNQSDTISKPNLNMLANSKQNLKATDWHFLMKLSGA